MSVSRLLRHSFGALLLLMASLLGTLSSCSSYRSDIMLRPVDKDGKVDSAQLVRGLTLAQQQYVIQPYDVLQLRIFTNNGELILDPNGELDFAAPRDLGNVMPSVPPASSKSGAGSSAGQAGSVLSDLFGLNNATVKRPTSTSGGAAAEAGGYPGFVVQGDGRVRLPMVRTVALGGLTLVQADSVLEQRYGKFYKDVYVISRVASKRVYLLGATDQQVVPLVNENTNLLQVLALAGGLPQNAKAYNVRLIRGDLRNPQVQLIDLSTIAGMRKANLQMQANDIVYVEPVRRPFAEGIRNIQPLILSVSSLLLALRYFVFN